MPSNRLLSSSFACLIAISGVLGVAPQARAATWDIDPTHSSAEFVVRHLVFAKVRGHFNDWSGTIAIDEKDITKSKVEVKFKAASIDTGTAKRDEHLRSADFFDATKFPEISFVSTKVEKGADAGTLKVTGNLTMKGVTKPVVITIQGPTAEFKDPGGNMHVAFVDGTAKLNRQEFGLAWSKAVEAGPVVGDEVALELQVELFKKR